MLYNKSNENEYNQLELENLKNFYFYSKFFLIGFIIEIISILIFFLTIIQFIFNNEILLKYNRHIMMLLMIIIFDTLSLFIMIISGFMFLSIPKLNFYVNNTLRVFPIVYTITKNSLSFFFYILGIFIFIISYGLLGFFISLILFNKKIVRINLLKNLDNKNDLNSNIELDSFKSYNSDDNNKINLNNKVFFNPYIHEYNSKISELKALDDKAASLKKSKSRQSLNFMNKKASNYLTSFIKHKKSNIKEIPNLFESIDKNKFIIQDYSDVITNNEILDYSQSKPKPRVTQI